MLSCIEIGFVITFFNFEKFGVKPGFPFFLTHTLSKYAGLKTFSQCFSAVSYPVRRVPCRGSEQIVEEGIDVVVVNRRQLSSSAVRVVLVARSLCRRKRSSVAEVSVALSVEKMPVKRA